MRLGRLLYIDFITRREASIRRSQRGNSEAIVGEMGGNINKTLTKEANFVKTVNLQKVEAYYASTNNHIYIYIDKNQRSRLSGEATRVLPLGDI